MVITKDVDGKLRELLLTKNVKGEAKEE